MKHLHRDLERRQAARFRCRSRAASRDRPSLAGIFAAAIGREDGATFEANGARKRSTTSPLFPSRLVLATIQVRVRALGGAPGVHSARFAADAASSGNASDTANNQKLLSQLKKAGAETARRGSSQ